MTKNLDFGGSGFWTNRALNLGILPNEFQTLPLRQFDPMCFSFSFSEEEINLASRVCVHIMMHSIFMVAPLLDYMASSNYLTNQ